MGCGLCRLEALASLRFHTGFPSVPCTVSGSVFSSPGRLPILGVSSGAWSRGARPAVSSPPQRGVCQCSTSPWNMPAPLFSAPEAGAQRKGKQGRTIRTQQGLRTKGAALPTCITQVTRSRGRILEHWKTAQLVRQYPQQTVVGSGPECIHMAVSQAEFGEMQLSGHLAMQYTVCRSTLKDGGHLTSSRNRTGWRHITKLLTCFRGS